MKQRIFSAFSAHPVGAHAAGEVAGIIMELRPEPPELLMLFIGTGYRRDLLDIVDAIAALIEPHNIVAVLVEGAVAHGSQKATGLGVSAFALYGGKANVTIVDRVAFDDPDFDPTAAILLADPFSCDADALLSSLASRFPNAVVSGGFLNGARAPGDNRIVVDSYSRNSGALLIFIDGAVEMIESHSNQEKPNASVANEGNFLAALSRFPEMEGALAFVCESDGLVADSKIDIVTIEKNTPAGHLAGCFVSELFSGKARLKDAASVLLFY